MIQFWSFRSFFGSTFTVGIMTGKNLGDAEIKDGDLISGKKYRDLLRKSFTAYSNLFRRIGVKIGYFICPKGFIRQICLPAMLLTWFLAVFMLYCYYHLLLSLLPATESRLLLPEAMDVKCVK